MARVFPLRVKGARITAKGVTVTLPLNLYGAVVWAIERSVQTAGLFPASEAKTAFVRQVGDVVDLLPTVSEINAALRAALDPPKSTSGRTGSASAVTARGGAGAPQRPAARDEQGGA